MRLTTSTYEHARTSPLTTPIPVPVTLRQIRDYSRYQQPQTPAWRTFCLPPAAPCWRPLEQAAFFAARFHTACLFFLDAGMLDSMWATCRGRTSLFRRTCLNWWPDTAEPSPGRRSRGVTPRAFLLIADFLPPNAQTRSTASTFLSRRFAHRATRTFVDDGAFAAVPTTLLQTTRCTLCRF